MKNVCIIVKENVSTYISKDVSSILDSFIREGFVFEEIRIIPLSDKTKIKKTVSALKDETDNTLLLIKSTALKSVGDLCSELFPVDSCLSSYGNARLYNEKKASLYLLASDSSEQGLLFAQNVCVPFLKKKNGGNLDKIVIRCVGANEAHLERLVAQAKALSENKLSFSCERIYDEDVLQIVYDESASKMLIDNILRLFADGLGDTMYALNESSLEEQLVSLLKLRGRKLGVAESFTGGGIGRRIVSVSGASEVYFEGINAYNEASKVKRLGVSEYTLRTLGAVSDQTAYEMAWGMLNSGHCDFAIATTGLAGPKTDRSNLPVGLCYIAVGDKERVMVYQYKFDGNRETVTEKAINYALFLAYKQLKKL